MTRKWPYPQDSALDRARSIARSFHAALHSVDPVKAEELAGLAGEFGEAWVGACVVASPDGLMSEADLAAYLGISRSAIRNMVARGVGPGTKDGQGRKLTRYPGGFDPKEAAELRQWAKLVRGAREPLENVAVSR